MILVFGGKYQGKLDFAKEKWGITSDEVLDILELCRMAEERNEQDLNYAVDAVINQNLDSAKCIYGVDQYIRMLISRGLDSDAWVERLKGGTHIVIMNDYSQGLVPIDSEDRAFREANGRAMIRLAEMSDEVYRVFCGIGNRIKP